ncbi:MAG: hypothetical protein PUH12_03300 [Lachnospiraceae bacterium]|nr:hypothetical protein [Lachnospiraceae bacterium]
MEQYYLDPTALLGGIVVSDAYQEIVHLSLKKGNEVPEYVIDRQITIFVIDGEIALILPEADETEVRREVSARHLVRLEPGKRHRMEALQDSQLLIIKT